MIALRNPRRSWWLYTAWAASFLAYTGFWFYYETTYGLWYMGPVPWWLTTGLTSTLFAAIAFTVVSWWHLRKRNLL